MKLIINYDFFEAIRDVLEPYGTLKIVRNNKDTYMIRLPLFGVVDLACFQNVPVAMAALIFQYMLVLSGAVYIDKKSGIDMYATISAKKVKQLVGELEEINVKTEYEMLLQANLYDKRYRLDFNHEKMPIIKEDKYIYVPSYHYDGSIKDTSILQEHMLGSDSYVLSVGEPVKKYQRVLGRA